MELAQHKYELEGQPYRLAYWISGSRQATRLVVCVHGLLRHSRDFDELSAALASDALVICPDLPGRGLSDWLAQPELYQPEIYAKILLSLVERFAQTQVDWVGTSLGGLIGMGLASLERSRISRLVLNDIGPFLPVDALQRIAETVEDRRFEHQAQVTDYLKARYPAYLGISEAQWQRLSRYGSRPVLNDSHQLALHYDPAIAVTSRALSDADIELWPMWQQVRQPVLVIHGLESDLLSTETVNRMGQDRDAFEVVEMPGIGHAPSLMESAQIAPILDWFDRSGAL